MNKEELKTSIISAFASTPYPGDDYIRGSSEGSEPYEIEDAFKGKRDWRRLDARFLDQSRLGAALSFFSDEAFRYYLPAYLLADVDADLEHVDVVFHLTHGFTRASCRKMVNPKRYGELTWFDSAVQKFSIFPEGERNVIRLFLRTKLDGQGEHPAQGEIREALEAYWERSN